MEFCGGIWMASNKLIIHDELPYWNPILELILRCLDLLLMETLGTQG
jgi:hypothetical protein